MCENGKESLSRCSDGALMQSSVNRFPENEGFIKYIITLSYADASVYTTLVITSAIRGINPSTLALSTQHSTTLRAHFSRWMVFGVSAEARRRLSSFLRIKHSGHSNIAASQQPSNDHKTIAKRCVCGKQQLQRAWRASTVQD